MKTVVFGSDVIEQDVKPHAKLNTFRDLLAREVRKELAVPEKLKSCRCPACFSDRGDIAFEKYNMTYLQCGCCNSLYVSPRPSDKILINFYRDSNAWQFWREHILPETRNARRKNIFNPRARWLLDVCDEHRPDAEMGVVVGYHSDLLLEELYNLEPNLFQLVVTNPIADIELTKMVLPNVSIHPTVDFIFDKYQPIDILLAFDFIDRCSDVELFFTNAEKTLSSGGLLIASTILTGFDALVLWDQSENIYPPDRLNLFSIEGLRMLSERHGFELVELSTPGMFDTESVLRAIRSNPEYEWPRFIRYLFENRDESAFREFQEFLQKYRLSSFGRIVLQKLN